MGKPIRNLWFQSTVAPYYQTHSLSTIDCKKFGELLPFLYYSGPMGKQKPDHSATQATLEPGRKARTLVELGKLAGVSSATASRALADDPLVNAKTRETIKALAREHGFRPNQMARRLRIQKTGVIGVVIPLGHDRRQHISDPFFMTMLGHLADALTESGQSLMLSRAIPEEDPEWLERLTGSGMVDGVLMIGQSDQYETIEKLATHYRPLVVWGTHLKGQHHIAVGSDNLAGGRMAAEHLLERGRRSLAFLGDLRGIEIGERFTGAQQAVAAFSGNASLHHLPVHLSTDDMTDEIAVGLEGLADQIDGIIAASDVIALAAIRQLHERGLAVPGDISVVGFDDLPLARQAVPQLTTIRQDIGRGAQAMVERLQALISGKPAESLVMLPEIMVRSST